MVLLLENEAKHEIEGIYKALLVNKTYTPYRFPEKIIVIRSGDTWTSDSPSKIVGLKIGKKIDEQERSK
jgi:hypothetical protein